MPAASCKYLSKLLLITFLFSCQSLTAQSYDVSYEGIEKGLPDRDILSIMQDDNGFMWFGTASYGLVRYDGLKYETFSTDPKKSIHLNKNRVNSIIKTKSGELWVANKGITIVNPKTMTSRNADSDKLISVNSLFRDSKGNIWGSDDLGLFQILNDDIRQVKRIKLLQNHTNYRRILEDKYGRIWVITPEIIYYLDDNSNYVVAQEIPANLLDKRTIPLIDLEGKIAGVYFPGYCMYIHIDTPKDLTSQPPQGLLEVDFIKKNYHHYQRDLEKLGLNFFTRLNYFKSSDNTIWIGTNMGLIKIRSYDTNFITCPDLKGCSLRGFYEDKNTNTILIGTYSGVYIYSPASNTARLIFKENVYSFLYRKGNRFLIMTESKGLMWLDLEQQKKIPIREMPSFFKKSNTYSLGAFLENNKVIFELNGKIYEYDIANDHITASKYVLPEVTLKDFFTNVIYKSKTGLLWAATSNGLFALAENKSPIRFPFSNNPVLGPDGLIHAIYEDDRGQLWLASKKYGLACIDPKAGTIVNFGTKDGLPNMETYCILSDDGGKNIWISTAHGLIHFDTQKKKFSNFFESSGLADNEFNRESGLKAADGTFYFGGINGLTCFFPKPLQNHNQNITPMLCAYNIYNINDKVEEHNFLGTPPQGITLSPYDNIIEFVLSSNNFYPAKKNVFSCQMEAFDNGWVQSGDNNIVRYMNLPAGNYRFKVKTTDGSGQWSENIIEIPVYVKQVFYKRTWFIVLMFLLLGLTIRAIFLARLRQIKYENEIRVDIASNIHDDLGGTLYAINNSARHLKTNLTDVKNLSDVDQLVKFCEEAYMNMGELIWSINPDNQFASSLLDRLEDYKDTILSSYLTVTSFSATGFHKKQKIKAEFKQRLLMIFKEALTNIVKHSVPEKIEIEIQNNPVFTMRITNYFTELIQPDLSAGRGLYNIRRRVSQMHGTIDIESENQKFSIVIKLKKSI